EAYNANPGSMRAALSLLGGMKNASRRVAVLGEMAELGPEAQSYHTGLVPLITANQIDRVHVVGELYSDLWKALPDHVRGSSSSSLRELEGELRRDLKDGDCLLVKGSHSTGLHKLAERFRRV